jgi:hypothetical protein
MLDMAATAADTLGQVLTDEFKRTFGSGHSDRAERLGFDCTRCLGVFGQE